HHRYWNGVSWTGDSFPDGPARPGDPAAGPAAGPGGAPAPFPAVPATGPSVPGSGPGLQAGPTVPSPWVASGSPTGSLTSAPAAPVPTPPSSPSPSTPGTTVPADPASGLLNRMVVTQNDVGSTMTVQPIGGGQGLGQPTLDLCDATYPSESLRRARLQVVAVDG